MAFLFCSVLLLLQLCLILAICLSCLYKWMGRKGAEHRGNEESCGSFPAVHSQRSCLGAENWSIYCQNEEGKYHGTASLWLERRFNTSQRYHLHLSLLCHTSFLPIYSNTAIGKHLITRDWNELSVFKFRNTQISPSAFRLAWILVWCVTLRTGCILTVLNLINPMFDTCCFICISCASWWLATGIYGDESTHDEKYFCITVASQLESCKQYRGKYYPK